MTDLVRSWDVLLIGGASGVGKTSISYRLAQHFGVGISEVDDFVEVLKRMTTPEQQPILHTWDTRPEAMNWSAEQIVSLTISVCQVIVPAVEAVIANHLESKAPVVLDGDYLLPSSVMRERVKGVFLYEPDEVQIVANFLRREPDAGEQRGRARVSWLFGNWLKEEAERAGAIALPARPWETLFERIVEAIT